MPTAQTITKPRIIGLSMPTMIASTCTLCQSWTSTSRADLNTFGVVVVGYMKRRDMSPVDFRIHARNAVRTRCWAGQQMSTYPLPLSYHSHDVQVQQHLSKPIKCWRSPLTHALPHDDATTLLFSVVVVTCHRLKSVVLDGGLSVDLQIIIIIIISLLHFTDPICCHSNELEPLAFIRWYRKRQKYDNCFLRLAWEDPI
jgi:hypothetical protein